MKPSEIKVQEAVAMAAKAAKEIASKMEVRSPYHINMFMCYLHFVTQANKEANTEEIIPIEPVKEVNISIS